jgi:hypothetical protein
MSDGDDGTEAGAETEEDDTETEGVVGVSEFMRGGGLEMRISWSVLDLWLIESALKSVKH